MLGDNPVSMMADAQLLRQRGILAITAFNIGNINEMAGEVKPDIVFFDPHRQDNTITNAYNTFVSNPDFLRIPVIFTLADDDIYLVTRNRKKEAEPRALVADNIIDAIKMALEDINIYAIKPTGKRRKGGSHIPAARPGLLFG